MYNAIFSYKTTFHSDELHDNQVSGHKFPLFSDDRKPL
jgi:hypothetical protein